MFNHSKYQVPKRTLEGLDLWAKDAVPPGDFLRNVLENNLFGAMGRADRENREAIYDITMYVYNELPAACWGSKELMNKWEGMSEGEVERWTN